MNKRILARVIAISILFSCNNTSPNEIDSSGPYYQFATSTEAVEKGKKDLLEIVKRKELKGISIDSSLLVRAEAEESVNTIDISLDLLLKADSIESMQDIVYKEKGRITPLYADDKIVTSIITRIDSGIWTVSGFRNQFVESDISVLRKIIPVYHQSEISLYEVPGVEAHIYGFKVEGKERYYTNYQGMTFDQPVALNKLIEMLKNDVKN